MRIVKEAYKHLSAYLQAQVSEIEWLDLWYEQVLFPELTEAIQYPAVFFEISASEMESHGLWEQRVFLRTSIYVAQISYKDTALAFPNMDAGLDFLEVLARIHEELQGYEHPDVGNLNRISFEPVQTPTNLIIYRMTYEHARQDISPMELRRQTITVSPVELCITKEEEEILDSDVIALTYPLPMPLQNQGSSAPTPDPEPVIEADSLFFIDC